MTWEARFSHKAMVFTEIRKNFTSLGLTVLEEGGYNVIGEVTRTGIEMYLF